MRLLGLARGSWLFRTVTIRMRSLCWSTPLVCRYLWYVSSDTTYILYSSNELLLQAEADIAFAERLFARLNDPKQPLDPTPDAFSPAFFVLDRFCRQRLSNANAQHLFGLICERIGHLDLAVEVIGRAVALLEAAYEETEDTEIERQYAIAHTNMARIRLAQGAYEEAKVSCDAVLALLEGVEDLDEQGLRLIVHARIYIGLACWRLESFEDAQQSLESALATAQGSEVQRHVVVLIAQVLWAIGTQEAKDAAKDRLLTRYDHGLITTHDTSLSLFIVSIAEDPDNLTAVNVLAGMGTLTDDENLVDAALSEILGLPIDQRHSKDPSRDITYLLMQHHLAQVRSRFAPPRLVSLTCCVRVTYRGHFP